MAADNRERKGADMTEQARTVTFDQIGVEVGEREWQEFLNAQRSGSFCCIRGYENNRGEIADHWVQFGISYPNIVAADVATLTEIIEGRKPFALEVKYGAWVDGRGEQFNRKAADRSPMTITLTLDMTDARLRAAVAHVREHLLHPDEATVQYDKAAKGAYSLGEGHKTFYIRDCLRVHKVVHKRGDYPFKASSQDVAIRDAVRGDLRVGRYRQFVMDGRWDSMTVGGQSILVDGIEERYFIAAPEQVKAVAAVESQG